MLDAFTRTPADLVLDLGSSNTRCMARGRDAVVDVPSVVALTRGARGREVVAVGEAARQMSGRAPGETEVVHPIVCGVISDFDATEMLIRHVLAEVGFRALRRPKLLMCVPSESTEAERRALRECGRSAGAAEVMLVPTALAAGVGAGLPLDEPIGNLLVEVGGGRCEAAVLSLGGIVVSRTLRFGGRALDVLVAQYLARRHGVALGERAAEAVRLRLACAEAPSRARQMRVRGREISTGAARELDVGAEEVTAAVAGVVDAIRKMVRDTLAETPPELAADIYDRGLLLTGALSRMSGLDSAIREVTGLPALLADRPEQCVVLGGERMLGDAELFHRALLH
jgi:rod shape-determining protein MreB